MTESFSDFLQRKIDETLSEIRDLTEVHLPLRNSGSGLADIGAKLALAEGKLAMLTEFRLMEQHWREGGSLLK